MENLTEQIISLTPFTSSICLLIGTLMVVLGCIYILVWVVKMLISKLSNEYKLLFEFIWFLQRRTEVKEIFMNTASKDDIEFLETKK